MNSKNSKTGIKLLFLVAIACFFFPFAMVSCSGESVEVTGFELATNISLHDEIQFDDEDEPNPYLIAGFICGLLGFGFAWEIKRQSKSVLVSGSLAAAGAVFLLLFRSTFWDFYKLTGYEGRVNVEFRWGWILSLLAYIGAAGVSLMAYLGDMSNDHLQSDQMQSPAPPADKHEDNNISLYSASDGIADRAQPNNISTQELASGKIHMQSDEDTSGRLPEDVHLSQISITGKLKTGEVLEWRQKDFPCFIGRNSFATQIAVPDRCASRVHARLYFESGFLMIADEGTLNGTIVNGKKISVPTQLLSGDQVTIGETILCFEISEH